MKYFIRLSSSAFRLFHRCIQSFLTNLNSTLFKENIWNVKVWVYHARLANKFVFFFGRGGEGLQILAFAKNSINYMNACSVRKWIDLVFFFREALFFQGNAPTPKILQVKPTRVTIRHCSNILFVIYTIWIIING